MNQSIVIQYMLHYDFATLSFDNAWYCTDNRNINYKFNKLIAF